MGNGEKTLIVDEFNECLEFS